MLTHSFFKTKSDLLGIASASLCVVHCLLTPILLVLAASSAGWWHEVSYVFLLISYYALYETSRHCTNRRILLLIGSSLLVLTASVLLEDYFEWLHEVSYLASLGLITGHILNIRYCKKCKHEHSS
ncbi:hypothetical protein HNQ92_002454 [Rhabdobacter roseus]|uniref:MerC domain-containing protein n=1 Tax=Rhabdobacter roseus TaxID=1655419 RepID=A0A840TL85_9BACT|nr:MerC domain-containing protein [Rhabdobacter roseus]MBB5284311.1 hypothetical protein [Rhabdobacter roseus]